MKRMTFILVLIICCIQLSFSQEIGGGVTGIVTDAKDGTAIPGVTVLVKGAEKATITDLDGGYSIVGVSENDVLVFTFVGMRTQEIPVNQQSVINVSMEEDVFDLEQVVVVAYGTSSKKSFTGSASVVETENLDRAPVTSFEKALATGIAGVQVSNNSGQPGSGTEIRIRGIGSFSASKEPLYVIDGVPVASGDLHSSTSSSGANPGNIMSTIPSGDIKSITVLKDAAAASLYGSRAANGVILITTKTGSKGATKYNLKTSYGISDFAVDNMKTVSGEDFLMLHRESMENLVASGNAPEGFDVDLTLQELGWVVPEEGLTDWYDHLFRKGITRNVDLSASGGNDKTTFYISGNLFKQDGIAYKSDMERYSGRINLTHNVSKVLSFGVNLLFSQTRQNIVDAGTNYYNPFYNITRNCFPTEGPYLPDGSYRPELQSGYYNIVRERDLNENSAKIFRSMNTGFIEFKPFEFLSFRSTNSYDWINNDETRYASPLSRSGEDENGYVSLNNRKKITKTTSNLLTYKQTFGENHNVNVIGAFEAEEERTMRYEAEGENLPNETLRSIGVSAVPVSAYGYDDGSSMLSYLSRVNYDYASKYYLSGSFRRDGSSKLGMNERWANFWSVSGAWRITGESFMESLSFVDDLKIRASYGTNGTLPPSRFEHLALYSYSGTYDNQVAAIESQISNENLTWEKNANFNVGLDFTFLERISGSVEYFQRNTKDLLMYLPISTVTGFSNTWRNIGEMENTGWELDLNTSNIKTEDFSWSTTLSLTTVANKIVKLNKNEDIVSGSYIRREGEPYYSFYMPLWAGVNPANGAPQWYTIDENENVTGITSDVSEAGKAIAGTADPDFFGSLGNKFSYKGINLSFLFTFSVGGKLYYSSGYKSWNDGSKVKYAVPVSQLDRWQKPGDNAKHPQRIWGGNMDSDEISSRFLLDNSYLRLKDITLSYTLPQSLSQKIKASNLTVYVQANNYFTWAEQDIVDPEQNYNGYVSFEIPNVKTLLFGLEIGF